MSECTHENNNPLADICSDCDNDIVSEYDQMKFILIQNKEQLAAKEKHIAELEKRVEELEEKLTAGQRMVGVLRNVAYEYDDNWRENSPRWQRYINALEGE